MSLDVSLYRKYHISYDGGKTLEEKEVDLTIYEPEKWFNYNVDCREQYEAIYNLKSESKNER